MLNASTIDHVGSERLVLRLFKPDDAADVFAAITPGLTRFMGWEPPATPEAFENVWRAWLTAQVSELHFVVRLRHSRDMCGLVGLHDIGHAEPELGVWIKEAAHGHGYGREAVAAVVAWASQKLNVSTFAYPVAEKNVASRRLAEALKGTVVGSRSRPKFTEVLYRIPSS